MKNFLTTLTILFVIAIFTACGADTPPEPPVLAPEVVESWAMDAPVAGGGLFGDATFSTQQSESLAISEEAAVASPLILTDRLVVRTANMSLETNTFVQTVANIEQLVELYDGFVETSSRNLVVQEEQEFWNANFVLRVPIENFDNVNNQLRAIGEVTNFTTFSEDVTSQFRDLETRMQIHREEERRLLLMISNATTVSDVITLQSRLSSLQLTMERTNRRMTEIDHLASFSTINLLLRESTAPAATNFAARLATAFVGSLDITVNMFVTLATIFFAVILPLAIISLPIILIALAVRKSNKNKKNLSTTLETAATKP
ncbi:MAG: DUF4349 domain-containing protein [Firmicutes bacterium]|nr:DUF4349 domain-containing protein [Bacillota bacterium]